MSKPLIEAALWAVSPIVVITYAHYVWRYMDWLNGYPYGPK